MKEGTKKLLKDEYEIFCKAMLAAAEEDELPAGLQINDISNITLDDIADICNDFKHDTGLEMIAICSACYECGKLHITLEVDHPEKIEE